MRNLAMNIIRRILVPTDFSELSLSGIDFIRSLAVLYDAELVLLHVVDTTPPPAVPELDVHASLTREETRAKERLAEIVVRLFPATRNITPLVRRGDPAKEIVRLASEEGADLIVIATHGRTGLAHVLMGSVAEKVVRHATVPVLTVKPESMRPPLMEQEDINEQLHY
jgi:nucleotide-binding universal stress UspA family protein